MIKRNIVLIILSVLVFSGIFSFRYLTQLDSVYFHKEAYPDLLSTISIWSSYDAPFGGMHMILWLYPLTFIGGFLGSLLNIDWNIIVRLLFYIPSIFLSVYSIQKLGDRFKVGVNGKFIMSLLYLFNTYFILLVDGGQLGVMLAYSILPLAIESILNINLFRTTTILSLIAIFDPRFFLIAIFTGLLIEKLYLKKILKLFLVIIFVLLINIYWILPTLKIGSVGVTTFISNLKLTSFINPLFLYQPHWPYNEFGKITYPNILFIIFPILLVISAFLKSTKEKFYWVLVFVLFSFLIKGETAPLGEFYSYIINNYTVASVFRDSTKFFAPLIIVYSLIIARYYDSVKNIYLNWIIPVLVIIPLLSGVIFGASNNLKGTHDVSNLINIKEKLEPSIFSRTVYIPQKPQIAFQTEHNQAIDGRVLVDYLPFAADNYGSEDRFNFMLRDSYVNYFRSLGIKNIVYMPKKKENTDPIIAKIENSMPEKYYIDKLAAVVGSPIGVENLVPEYGVVFLEDGKSLLSDLFKIPSSNLFFYLNNKEKTDLIISGLRDKFIDPSLSATINWAKYTKDDYLTWKYQLLIREIDTKDINFESGIIMSTVKDETSSYPVDIRSNSKYKIFIRALAGKDSKGIFINDTLYKIPFRNTFTWVANDFVFDSSVKEITVKNNGGFNVVAQILLIEDEKYQAYLKETNEILKDYKIFNQTSNLPSSEISYDQKEGFLIFNQSYNKRWKFKNKNPFPINSMTNGYYIDKSDLGGSLVFDGQETLDLAAKVSLASVLAFIVSYFGYAIYKKSHKSSF